MSNQISEISAIAAARYEAIAGKSLDKALLSQMKSLDSLTTIIEKENNSFTAFREKRKTFFHALSVGLGPITKVLDTFSLDISAAAAPSSIVFGAIKLLTDAAKGVSDKYDAIINLFNALKDFAIRLEVYAQQMISERLKDKLSEVLVALIEVLALARKEVKHGRLFAFGKSLIGAGGQGSEAWDKLQKLVDGERGLVGAETLTEVKGVAVAVSDLSKQIEALALVQNAAKEEATAAGTSRIMERIKGILQPTTSAEDRYWAINRSRVAGTGDWIREEQTFKSWMGGERAVLWIEGNPGSGKSYIASNIITYLLQQYSQKVQLPTHTSVAYFFFNDDDSKTRSILQALRDMAFQIAMNDSVYAKYLVTQVSSSDQVASISSAWKNLYAEFFIQKSLSDSRVILLLDGLDEAYAADREEFFDLAKDIQDGSESRMQLAMLGRFQILDEIIQVMELPDVLTIPITASSNRDDIERYVELSISKSAFLKRAPKDRRDEIVRKICDKAQGMFIWVDLMLKDITKRAGITTWNKLLVALDKAPRGLDKMITHVLEGYSAAFQGDDDAATNLNELLTWVACSDRPLLMTELEGLLEQVQGSDSDMIWLERSLRIQFASIFVLTRDDGLTTADLHRTHAIQDDIDLIVGDTKSGLGVVDQGVNDVENPTSFDSDPKTTSVSFAHASIGDYFRDEQHGPVTAAHEGGTGNVDSKYPAVGVNIAQARIHCLKVCLDVLSKYKEPSTTEEKAKSQKLGAVYTMFQTSFMQYLARVDIGTVPVDDKKEIGELLARLFVDAEGLATLRIANEYSEAKDIAQVLTVENAAILVKWLGDEDVQRSISSDLSTAYAKQMSSGNTFDVFAGVARHMAHAWLRPDIYHVPDYAWFSVLVFRKHRYGVNFAEDLPAALISAAEWSALEQTASWHQRLAVTLRRRKAYKQAIDYFQRAIDLDPPFFLARQGMAVCLQEMGDVAGQIEYDEKLMSDLNAAFPDNHGKDTESSDNGFHLLYERLAQGYGQLDQLDKAVEFFIKGQDASAELCSACAPGAAGVLQFLGRWAELLSFVDGLEQRFPETADKGPFVCQLTLPGAASLISGPWYLAMEWTNKERVRGHLDATRKGIVWARQAQRYVLAAKLEVRLGQLLWRQGDFEGASRIIQRLITTYTGTTAEVFVAALLFACSIILAQISLIRCMEVEGGPTSIEGQRHGAMIEWLVRGASRESRGDTATWVAAKPDEQDVTFKEQSTIEQWGASGVQELNSMLLALIAGHYLRLVGREDDAMAAWRSIVRAGLAVLGDEDPENDDMGFELLWMAFAAVGDDDDALAMLHLYALTSLDPGYFRKEESSAMPQPPPPEAITLETGTAPKHKKPDAQPRYIEPKTQCSNCGTVQPTFEGMVLCRYCPEALLCRECYKGFKSGTIGERRHACSTKHGWLELPNWGMTDLMPPGKGLIKVRDSWVDLEGWKEGIKKKWNV